MMQRHTSSAGAVTVPSWRDAHEREHFAQVYESDDVLLASVADYVQSGLEAGAGALLIATSEHIQALLGRWTKDLDVEGRIASGQLVLLDAKATLAELMCDGAPDAGRFRALVGGIMAKATSRWPRVVAFGEMVNLLWQDGLLDAAVQLEDLWNELAQEHPFTLFCAYHLHGMASDRHVVPFESVCARHSRVIPAESAMRLYSGDPLRTIAALQQKAFVLDQERRSRGAIEETMSLLASIVTSSDDAIVSKTLEGVIRSWNAGAQRIFGYSPDEAIGQPITMIIPPELMHEERMILAKIRAGERVEHFETTRVAKDGRRIPISLTVSPLRDAAGRIVGASKIARDISDRKRAEAAAEDSRRQFEQEARALAQLNDWSSRLWRCEALDYGLEQMLDAVIALLGATRGNVQLREGDTLRIVAARGFKQEFLDAFQTVSIDDDCGCGRVLRSAQTVIIEDVEVDAAYAPYLAAARQAGYRAVVSVPLFGSEKAIVGVLSVHFPEPHRPTEHELRRMELYARQAGDFIQRCAVEEILRVADRRKTQFLATLAHEMRTPLAPLRSGLQVMKLAQGDAEVVEQTRAVMERQVDHMVRLVEDLMDVSRIGQGKIELRCQLLDLNRIIDRAVEACRPKIEAEGHLLLVDIPFNPIPVNGDDTRLTQVFSNLLANAAKYTERGGTIRVACAQENDSAIVHVSDTGIGIAPEMLDKVFDLFSQADDALGRAQGGVGIGLSLVKGLVEKHGGSVKVESEGVGKGSHFIVRLPVASLKQPADVTA